MLPFRDDLLKQKRSWGVIVICALLALTSMTVWLNDVETQAKINFEFGFIPLELAVRPWISLLKMVSAGFLHGDLLHLAGNCLFLWVFGRSLESLFGTRALLILFPFLGISGFCLHWVLYPKSVTPVIGASAAISTLLGAYFALFPKAHIRTLFIFGWFFRIFDAPAWIFLLYWSALQFLGVALGSESTTSVAYAVHVGGFILGVIGAIIWKVSYPFAEEQLLTFTQSSS